MRYQMVSDRGIGTWYVTAFVYFWTAPQLKKRAHERTWYENTTKQAIPEKYFEVGKIRTRGKKKPAGVLKNVTQDQQGRTKIVLRCAEEEQINAARTKQHEDEQEDTGIRPAGREK